MTPSLPSSLPRTTTAAAASSLYGRLRHLFFEDFLEALVRLSSMIALPTDADIAQARAKKAAADFLHSSSSSSSSHPSRP